MQIRANWLKPLHFNGRSLLVLATGTLAFFGAIAHPAHAQFVCQQFGAGTGGATAAGGFGNVACGSHANASGPGFNTAIGDEANASGDAANTATGYQSKANGTGAVNTATGALADAHGDLSHNTATGAGANASGELSNNTASGREADASGDESDNTATGMAADASGTGSQNVAMGKDANASGDGTANTAVGASSVATGANASAFGTGASATHANSAAFGQGATTSRVDQQVFGTASNTYTFAGIASDASRAAQGAPTHFVTSNANGDLAAYTFAELGFASPSDISNLHDRDRELAEGIAVALSLDQPVLLPGQNFAMRLGWGNFDGTNAVGVTAAGVLARDATAFGPGTSVTLDGGIGAGTSDSTVAGKAGLSFGW